MQAQTPHTQAQGQEIMLHIPVGDISVREDFNPRRYFDDAKQRELAASVAEHGVIQPILVYQKNGSPAHGYWLIAGERRFRAAQAAGLATIPATVREVTDEEAFILATVENSLRTDMSPPEEAQAARRILHACNNDKEEALRVLGWSETKFKARIALLHAAAPVLDALTKGDIKLGHAELLSQLPEKTQIGTLAAIIAQKISVADLKTRIQGISLELIAAPFSILGCSGCPRNSNVQASLFEEHIQGGRCSDRECYGRKAQEALLLKKAELADQFNVVFLDTEREKASYRIVMASGAEGVGVEQFNTGCKGCAHFGALLDTSPGKEGRVIEDCCFNLACHKQKLEAHRQSLKSVSEPEKTTSPAGKLVSDPKRTGNAAKAATGASPKSVTEPAAKAHPAAVTEKVHATVRTIAAKVASSQGKKTALALGVFALLKEAIFDKSLLPDGFKSTLHPTRPEAVMALSGLADEELLAISEKALAYLLEKDKAQAERNGAPSEMTAIGATLLTVNQTDLANHFILSREFLSPFTKAGIEAVLREAVNGKGEQFTEYWNRGGEGAFNKLMGKKKDEILDAVFAEKGFDFSGFVPSCVIAALGDTRKQG